jgi:hypothetical protein
MQTHHFVLFADLHQFYLQDEFAAGNVSARWTDDAAREMLAVTVGAIAVRTFSNMFVPVAVQILERAPMQIDYENWDQINECSIEFPSGKIVIAGATDHIPTANCILVEPGTYRARIFYSNEIPAGDMTSKDHYQIDLWPASHQEKQVLKQKPLQDQA